MQRWFVWIGAVLALALTSSKSHATHKSWVLRDDGAHCAFAAPDPALDDYFAGVGNIGANGRVVECPVSLSARMGSSGNVSFAAARWARSMWGSVTIRVDAGSSAVSCQAVGMMASGSVYFGNTVSVSSATTTQGGVETIYVNNHKAWGGTLQTHETEVIKSLVYECKLAKGAQILGYRARICQNVSIGFCDDGATTDEATNNGTQNFRGPINESGIACYSLSGASGVTRGFSGIVNGSQTSEDVACELTAPASDSYEHAQLVSSVRVYYRGAAPDECMIWWYDPSIDDYDTSDSFVPDFDFNGRPVLRNSESVLLPVHARNAVVRCNLSPGRGVEGITAQMDLTTLSGGF